MEALSEAPLRGQTITAHGIWSLVVHENKGRFLIGTVHLQTMIGLQKRRHTAEFQISHLDPDCAARRSRFDGLLRLWRRHEPSAASPSLRIEKDRCSELGPCGRRSRNPVVIEGDVLKLVQSRIHIPELQRKRLRRMIVELE